MDAERVLGRDRGLTRQLLALAVGSFVAVLGLGVATGVTGTVEVTLGDAAVRIGRTVVFPVGAGALLAGAALAAYANDGLAVSWAVTFAPAFGYLLALFDPETAGGVAGVLAQAAFWAGFVAAALGSVGYAVGRGLRERRSGAPDEPDEVWSLLVGRDRAATRQVLVVAGGLFLSTLAVVELLAVTGTARALATDGPAGALVALGTLVALAALQAHRNDGLVLSWAVVFAPTYAFVLQAFAGDPIAPLVVDVFYAAELAAVAALLAGTGGFLVGTGARRFGLRFRTRGSEPA